MRAAWKAWKQAGKMVWANVLRLIILNLIWFVIGFPIVTIGPATLAAYWWIATSVRDGQGNEPYTRFFQAMRRFAVKGLVWLAGWVVVIGLAAMGLKVWPQLLPPMGVAMVQIAWTYAILYLVAMQPYLLEYLTVEEKPWVPALKASAWQVLANPIYSHAHVAIAGVALGLAAQFSTVASIALVAVLLGFWTVAAAEVPWKHGRPRPIERRIEDVL